jgi:TRAP-type mannitol/chloroaromatic compound transport system substrate-binding protein
MMWEFANGEALQGPALKELKEKGVQIHMWSPEILDAMREQWGVVIEEEKAASPMFAKMWESLSNFRADYKEWKDVGYLP